MNKLIRSLKFSCENIASWLDPRNIFWSSISVMREFKILLNMVVFLNWKLLLGKYDSYIWGKHLKINIFAFITCLLNLQNKVTRFIVIFSLITNFMGVSAESRCPPESPSNGTPVCPSASSLSTTPKGFYDYRH